MIDCRKNDGSDAANRHAVRYALRRTLPPWSFDDNLKELEKLPEYGVDELIVKVDTEEFSHGIVTPERLKTYLPGLTAIRDKLRSMGIAYSLNPWFTLGHCDRGRRAAEALPGVQTMVDWDGSVSSACCCPLSEAWRENMRETWTMYAGTAPTVFWVEDDIRSFNHGAVRFGCFCPLHMRRFSALVGREVSRKELTSALMQPGAPHPWRRLYLRMQGEIMAETARLIGQTVRRASPETALGLMSSGPRNHTMEDRLWEEFARALAAGGTLYSRPPSGVYQEISMRDLYWGADAILHTRAMLPEGTMEQAEVENWSFTRFSKSVTMTSLQMALSVALGCPGITLNLFDHAGTPMEAAPEMGRMLRERKPYLDALAKITAVPGKYRGAQMIFSPRYGEIAQLERSDDLFQLAEDGTQPVMRMHAHGIPVVYGEENCRIACGQSIRALSDGEIRRMLGAGQGLFLDAAAAKILCERSFGELIGVISAGEPVNLAEIGAFSAEEHFRPEFGGGSGRFMNLFANGSEPFPFIPMTFAPEAKPVTRLVGPDRQVFAPGIVVVENPLGGRVAVSTQTMKAWGPAYNSENRRHLLEAVFDYLSFDSFPVRASGDGVYPLLFRKDCEAWITAGIFNISLDPWRDLRLTLSMRDDEQWDLAELLHDDGSCTRIVPKREKGHALFDIPGDLPPCRGAVIRIFKKTMGH